MRSDAAKVKRKLFAEGTVGDVAYPDLAVAVDTDPKGNVRLNFGRPLTWFSLTPKEALALAISIAGRAGATRIEIE